MKFALVENDVVVQIDETQSPPENFLPVADDVFPGYTLDAATGLYFAPSQPATVPQEISDRQFFQQLAIMNLITEDEAEAAVSSGTLPAAMAAFIEQLPGEERFPARMKLKGATTFIRNNPLVVTFGEMQGMSSEQIDDLWRAAALL